MGVADLACFVDHTLCESAADALATKLRAKVQTFHFTSAGGRRGVSSWCSQLVQRDTSRELAGIDCQQQAPSGRGVVTGKSGQFFVESLETKAEALLTIDCDETADTATQMAANEKIKRNFFIG